MHSSEFSSAIGVRGTQIEGTILPTVGQPIRSQCHIVVSLERGGLTKNSSKKKRTMLDLITRAAASATGDSNTNFRNSGTLRDM